MKYSVLEKNVIDKLEEHIRDVTPGVAVRAYQGGRIICDVAVGTTYPYYDYASLTKVIFTVQAMMWAWDLGKWNFESKVSDFLPWYKHPTLVAELLTHTSGLSWWTALYQNIDLTQNFEQKRKQLKDIISEMAIEKADKAVYSDIGFITLGFVIEELFQKDLYNLWQDVKNKFYLGTTLDFHKNNAPPLRASLYAPTEDCPVRKKLVQGEVHDLNTWALGGVSSHAGLFGSIDDLGWFLLHLRSQLMGIARYTIKQKTAQLFSRRAISEDRGDWALGYMMPTPGASSSGDYFSLESIGHTGFTGTSLWYDPKMDLGIGILSNRVLYGPENKAFASLRPQIHNWIVENFRKSGT